MLFTLHVRVVEATDIPRMDANATDAYCLLQTSSESLTTFVVKNSMNPRWNQEFHFSVSAPTVGSLRITMRDKDAIKDDNISYIDIQYCSMPVGQVIDMWYDMIPFNRVRKGGRLHLVLHMAPANSPPFVPTVGGPVMQGGYPAVMTQPMPPPMAPVYQQPPPPPVGYPTGGCMQPPPTAGYPPVGYGQPPSGYMQPPPAVSYPQPGYAAPPPPMGYGAARPPVYGQPYPAYKPHKGKNHHYGYKRNSSSSSS